MVVTNQEVAISSVSQLSVSVVDSDRKFHQLAEAWIELLQDCPRPVPFLTWEWVSTWWKHFSGDSRLFILVARDEDAVVRGIAPLKITTRRGFGLVPVRTVEFLGYRGSAVCADHLDFLTSQDDRATIVHRLVEEVFTRHTEWDALALGDLAEDSLVPAALTTRTGRLGIDLAEGPTEVCPFILLDTDWEPFLSRYSGRRRKQIRRLRQILLEDHGAQFIVDFRRDELHARLETLAQLHALSRERKGEGGSFRHRAYLNFHYDLVEKMAEKGFLYLARLDVQAKTVAAWYGFHLGRVLFFYQTGFDTAFAQYSVGDVLQACVIQDAIERLHAGQFDFLRGAEPYKYRWTSEQRRTNTLLCWQDTVVGRLAQGDFRLRNKLSSWKHGVRALWGKAAGGVRPDRVDCAKVSGRAGASLDEGIACPQEEDARIRNRPE